MARWLFPCVLTLVLAVFPARAADLQYTFETLDLPAVSGAQGRLLNLQAIANDAWLAGGQVLRPKGRSLWLAPPAATGVAESEPPLKAP